MQLAIRPVHRGDLDAIEVLDAEVYGGTGYGPYVVRQLFDLFAPTFFVAESAGNIIGYCVGARAHDGVGWVLSLATSSSARRTGVGAALSQAVLRAFAASGLAIVRLTVAPDNAGARRLYERLGFREIGVEPAYYGADRDRLVMEYNAAT